MLKKSLIYSLLVVGLFLRIWGIGEKSLWLDEAVSFHYADPFHKNILSLVEEVRKVDAHPPLYYLLLHIWLKPIRWFQGKRVINYPRQVISERILRFPSFIFAFFSLLLFYILEREAGGKGWGTILFSFSAYHIYYAQEARNYSLVVMLALLSFLPLIREFKGRWLLLFLVWLAGIYTYLYFSLLILSQVIWWIGFKRGKERYFPITGILLAVLILFLPYFPSLWRRITTLPPLPFSVNPLYRVFSFIYTPVHFTLGEVLPYPSYLILLLFFLVMALVLFPFFQPVKEKELLFLLSFLIPLILGISIPLRSHIFDPKFLIFSLPSLYLLFSFSLKDLKTRFSPFFFTLILLGNILSLSLYFSPSLEKEDWRGLVRWVERREGEKKGVVLFNPDYIGYAFDYYYGGRMRRRGYKGREEFDSPRVFLVEDFSPVSFPGEGVEKELRKSFFKEEEKIFPGYIGRLRVSIWKRKGG